MANELTGDFDVVAEFSLPAVNRLLAAMHRIERFPHSLALRVDDDPPPGTRPDRPTIAEAVDAFGDPPADHGKIGIPVVFPGTLLGTGPGSSPLDSVVNPGVLGVNVDPIVPSRLRGRAQLQLSPPTLHLTQGAGGSVTVRLQVMSRYFPDPQTPPVAEFVHGTLQLTAPVNQVASQVGNVVDIGIKASTLGIDFTPTWWSQPLTAEDLAGVVQLIRNALKTSFLPSNITLPPGLKAMQFKAVGGAPGAVGVLLNLREGPHGNPAGVTKVFLAGGDDFAFAAGIEFIRAQFQATVDTILGRPLAPIGFSVGALGFSTHVTYTVTLTGATVDLPGGRIVLTITGHAHTSSWLPDFDFRVRQPFTLSPSGPTVDLVVGDVSIDITSGGIAGWLINLFTGLFRGRISQARDQALAQSGARETVRRALNADENLGGVLKVLLTPPDSKSPKPPLGYQLAYTTVEIRPSAIVLHGTLAVAAWPTAHVEFEQIASAQSPVTSAAVPEGPDHSALKTWIPGGRIQRYEWSSQGQPQPFRIEEHRFVLLHGGPEASGAIAFMAHVPGYTSLCLTVRGVRLSSSGPVVEQPVSAMTCGYSTFPIVSGLALASNGSLPLVALTHPSPTGTVEVAGHTTAGLAEGAGTSPNLLVHFADERTAGRLGVLVQAAREGGNKNAATAIVAMVPAQQLASTPYTDGVVYAEDEGGVWERVFDVRGRRRPLTLIVAPDRKVVWQHEGEVESGALAAALRKLLVSTGPMPRGIVRSNLRIGQPTPNFVFEYAPGRQLTLRKLAGRPVTLVFRRSTLRPCVDALRDLETGGPGRDDGPPPVVLAINDGESPQATKQALTEKPHSAITVGDPDRAISSAYGVTVWPTIVALDAAGLVRTIRYGRLAH